MTEKDKKVRQESDSPLEALRLDHTQMNQDEFTLRCGIPKTTYFRWVTGKTPVKLTPQQVAAVCQVCNISLRTMFHYLGVDVDSLPTSKSDKAIEQNHITHHEISKQNDMLDESERQGAPQGFLRNLRNRLDISQERLAGLIGVTGQTISRCERGQTEITLTVLEFKRLCRLAKKTSIEELPDYLGKPPEENPEEHQQE